MKIEKMLSLKQKISIGSLVALCLCMLPILEPYIIGVIGSFDIRIADLLCAVIAAVFVWKNKKVVCLKNLAVFCVLLWALNYVAFLTGKTSASGMFGLSQRVWILWVFYGVIFSTAFMWADFAEIEKWALRIATAACVLLIVQFVFYSLDIEFWNGRIPFLPLSKYDGWSGMVDVTGAIRVHSVFQEPAYVGIYLLPITAVALQRKRFWQAALFVVSILLSTSTLAIGGLCMVLAVHLFYSIRKDHSWKAIRVYVFGAAAILVIGLAAYLMVPAVRHMVNYSGQKILKVLSDLGNPRMGSTKIRLLGNIFLYPDYSFLNKLVGVGINQYTILFAEQIQYSYSNSVVNTLLNSGLIGAIAFVAMGVVWCVKSSAQYRIFPVLFLFVMFTDQMLFNWYFFYMFLWMMYGLKKSGKEIPVITVLTWDGARKIVTKCVYHLKKFYRLIQEKIVDAQCTLRK